jgi:Tetratricopeptide repeat
MKAHTLRFLFAVLVALTARAAVTFTHDVAPIVFQHCATCHRPGQSAPFPLLTYADCRKHAADLADVTSRRYMPPWLPAGTHGEFVGDRRLGDVEIAIFRAWADAGAPEGDAKDLPPPPSVPPEWELGPPDAIAQMPAPYLLKPGGRDVYRHFVLPLTRPLDRPRWVRAFEFHPNSRQVHHTFLFLARTNDTRRLAATSSEVGFGGMDTPPEAQSPSGFFLSWQPGRPAEVQPPGLAWKLSPGFDLLLQMHLQPGGKPEPVQGTVGLWFTDTPPTNQPVNFSLTAYDLDFAPGDSNAVVTREFSLPVDVDLLAVLPHAHYLGHRLEGFAVLPDGARRTLLSIPDWDFNWQSAFKFNQPVFLPAGSQLQMRFAFDNSAGNPRNPSKPPRRVTFGLNTTDEMAELWLQMLPRTREGGVTLERTLQRRLVQKVVDFNLVRLKQNPADVNALVNLGRAHLTLGQRTDARRELEEALRLAPTNDAAHYQLGYVHRLDRRFAQAAAEFRAAIAANPDNGPAHGNLALLALEAGQIDVAVEHFQAALRADPDDNLARLQLAQIRLDQGRRAESIALMEEAVRHAPDDAELAANLAKLRALK